MKNLRIEVKSRIAQALHGTSMDNLIGRANGAFANPLVICYHRVVPNFDDAASRAMPSLIVGTTMFEKQLDWLTQHFDLVSLDEILLSSERPSTSEKRRKATITFDDGYADFYWHALPLLVKKNIPATVFVVTDLVGTTDLQVHDELYLLLSQWFQQPDHAQNNLDDPLSVQMEAALARHSDPYNAARYILASFSQREVIAMMKLLQMRVTISTEFRREFQSLDWSMLQSMVEQGVTIGSHTRSHALLPHHDQQRVITELRESYQQLESELGSPPKFLAYPDGQFNERIASAAETAGYTAAFTICNHRSVKYPLFSMPRTVLWENACMDQAGQFSPAIMGCLVNGVFNRSSGCTQDHNVS